MVALRKWFNPEKKEVWRQLNGELAAKLVKGEVWKDDRVEVSHGDWTITLDLIADSYVRPVQYYTRIRAPYVNQDNFRFSIYREGIFSSIMKQLGMQDVQVGYEEFDQQFIIQGNNVEKLKQFLDNEKIRKLLLAQGDFHLTVYQSVLHEDIAYPHATDVISFQIPGYIDEIENLKQLFELFAEILDQLCLIGSAYENAPQVES